jgi:hypothetical protein
MRRSLVVLLSMFLAGSGASTAAAQHRWPTAAERQAHREAVARARARRDLLRDLELGRITLREAARRVGGTLVLDQRPNLDCFPQSDVRGLADRSSLVIMGRPLAAAVELTDDRRSIATTYSVQVDDTFKGRQLSAFVQHVIVRVPGGRIDFGDGTSAETRSGPSLTLGDRYVLFLQHEPDGRSGMPVAWPGTSAAAGGGAVDGAPVIYTPFRVDQGVFHLQADGKMRSHAQTASGRLHRYDGMPEAVFLAEVKTAVEARRLCNACFSSHRIRFSSLRRRISQQ